MALKGRLRELVYDLYEKRLYRQLDGARSPRHVGVILDGNRRWAKEAGLDISHGHRAGARKIVDMLGWCSDANVEVVTLWLLSTDNLNRTSDEIDDLLGIIAGVVDELTEPGTPWRVRIVGALDLLPTEISARLSAAALRTQGRESGLQVNVAVGYGGRREIADAVRKLLLHHAQAGTTIEELAESLDVDQIAEHLYTSGQPDPDLLIRTSGEQRLSGFMLWQSAHSEFWFCDAYWPAFRRVDFLRALREFALRNRRFGG